MGLGTERHDTMSQETHAGQWLGFRQPVCASRGEARRDVNATYERQPRRGLGGNEFWIALSWKIDPDGSLGIRKFFESPYRPGEQITVDEILRLDVRELGARAAGSGREGRAHAARVHAQVRRVQGLGHDLQPRVRGGAESRLEASAPDDGRRRARTARVGVVVDGVPRRLQHAVAQLEFYSPTMVDWGWPEHAMPRYVPGHVHWRDLNRARGTSSICCRTSGCRR